MRLAVISFKECWRGPEGAWYSYGGFPAQMTAIAALFDSATLCVVEGPARRGGIPLPPGARVVPLRSPAGADGRRKLSVLSRLPEYWRAMSEVVRQADVVHTPVPGDIALLGMVAALAHQKRLIARYGGSWTPTSETTLMNRVTRQIMRSNAGGRNVMLATGAGQTPPAPRMAWVYATAITRDEVARLRPDLARPAGAPVEVVYAGRLSPEKGVADLIEAMVHLRADGVGPTRLHLTLAGDGPAGAQIRARVAAAGLGGVTFAGQLDRSALMAALMTADLCVLPSLTESFCKARLDAMLCGTPVLTTEVGCGRALVGADGERGWIVPAKSPAAIAARLAGVQSEALDWPALRRRCRAFAESYTVEGWGECIGKIAAAQWGVQVVNGRLVG